MKKYWTKIVFFSFFFLSPSSIHAFFLFHFQVRLKIYRLVEEEEEEEKTKEPKTSFCEKKEKKSFFTFGRKRIFEMRVVNVQLYKVFGLNEK